MFVALFNNIILDLDSPAGIVFPETKQDFKKDNFTLLTGLYVRWKSLVGCIHLVNAGNKILILCKND